MYGAGVLESIVQRKIDGVERDYYMMKLPNRSMVVMIPTEHSEDIGVRPVVDANQAGGDSFHPGGDDLKLEPPLPREYGAPEKR